MDEKKGTDLRLVREVKVFFKKIRSNTNTSQVRY